MIPRCSATAAPSPGSANVPSAAFVLGPGGTVSEVSKVPKGGDPVAFGIKTQVTLPSGSPAVDDRRRAVPGQGEGGEDDGAEAAAGSGGVAIAPNC